MPYADPVPAKRLFGWGDIKLQPAQRMLEEAHSIERLHQQTGIVYGAKEATGSKMMPKIEQKLRSFMKFDEGWSFFVAEALLYGLSPEQTLMLSQLIGNCVGASHAALIAAKIAQEVYAEGEAEEPLGMMNLAMPFWPYTYGVGRWVGGMLGPGDGSYCGAQIEGSKKYGFLPCFTPGLEVYSGSGNAALPQGSASANKLFGRSKAEIQKWTDKAAAFDLLEAPQAKTGDDAMKLVVEQKIPLQICSNWGFKYDKFDSHYGVHLYKRSGSWPHSMQVMAIFKIKGQWFTAIRNQWGLDAHKGSPEIGIPGGCFVIPFELFSTWIRSSETLGIGAIQGLPSNPGY